MTWAGKTRPLEKFPSVIFEWQMQMQKTENAKTVRAHQVKVMLNDDELALLDSARGHLCRAETFRLLLRTEMPAPMPPVNLEVWQKLSKSAANLNQIAHRLNVGDALELAEIQTALADFRSKLLG